MAAGVIFMQWDSYAGGTDAPPFFAEDPLTFNTRQERLHRLYVGDRLWLVSGCPADGQYYFTCALRIAQFIRNTPDSDIAVRFGEYAILAEHAGGGRAGFVPSPANRVRRPRVCNRMYIDKILARGEMSKDAGCQNSARGRNGPRRNRPMFEGVARRLP